MWKIITTIEMGGKVSLSIGVVYDEPFYVNLISYCIWTDVDRAVFDWHSHNYFVRVSTNHWNFSFPLHLRTPLSIRRCSFSHSNGAIIRVYSSIVSSTLYSIQFDLLHVKCAVLFEYRLFFIRSYCTCPSLHCHSHRTSILYYSYSHAV